MVAQVDQAQLYMRINWIDVSLSNEFGLSELQHGYTSGVVYTGCDYNGQGNIGGCGFMRPLGQPEHKSRVKKQCTQWETMGTTVLSDTSL